MRIRANGDSGLREIGLELPADSTATARGGGTVSRDDGLLIWRPAPGGRAELRYRIQVDHHRQGHTHEGYDALVTKRWALFRGEDVFPLRRWRWRADSEVSVELAVRRPAGWSVITPYLPDEQGRMRVRNAGDRMARPIGWILAGEIGTRRDFVDGLELTVSAPRDSRPERLGMLALLRWTLPAILPHLPGRPDYISIVTAGDPMWLGALSAPNSIYVHKDRPLISENGTSTLVHEMMHVLLADLRTARLHDWIDEGLAEYLGLRALRDSGTISTDRYERSIRTFRQRGAKARSMRTAASSGPVTARAVAVFHDLDAELRSATRGREDLYALVRTVMASGQTTDLEHLRTMARRISGKASAALSASRVPGFQP